jgi:hypothetical protein
MIPRIILICLIFAGLAFIFYKLASYKEEKPKETVSDTDIDFDKIIAEYKAKIEKATEQVHKGKESAQTALDFYNAQLKKIEELKAKSNLK